MGLFDYTLLQQRALLHAAQEAVLSEIEITWHIEQVARANLYEQ